MKQLASTYTVSGAVVTLTGVNITPEQLLFVADNTAGTVLYAPGTSGVTVTSGTDTTITFGTSLASNSDSLTIFYDDGVSPAKESGGNLDTITGIVTSGVPVAAADGNIAGLGQLSDYTTATTFGGANQSVISLLKSIAGWTYQSKDLNDKTQGAIGLASGSAATDSTSSWTVIQLLKGLWAKIPAKGSSNMAGSLPVTLATDGPGVSNLSTIASNTSNIPAKGAANTANSTPVNIANDQTVPASVSGTYYSSQPVITPGGSNTLTMSSSSHLLVGTYDGQNVTQGAKADSAYAGSGSASLVAILKGIFSNTTKVAGFSIPAYDYKTFTYSSGNVSTIVFKSGGSGGTTVATLTYGYDGSNNLTSITKS